MGSRGRMPPRLYTEHPPYSMPPHSDILEQKLSDRHIELQKLLRDNKLLSGSVGDLKQELAAKQLELKAVKLEREKQKRALIDKIAKMEADLKAAKTVESDLEKGRADAHCLVVDKQELISKTQKLTRDIESFHEEAHNILPALVSELEGLRHEYMQIRAVYDYEKTLSNGQLEALQAMEKNYANMAREANELQAGLSKTVSAQMLTRDIQRPTYYYENKLYNGRLESTQVVEKNYVNLAREIEKFEAGVNIRASAVKQADGHSGGTGYNKEEVSGQHNVGKKTTEDNDGVQKKPSRSALRTYAKRRQYREMKKAKEVFPAGQKTAEDNPGVAQV